MLHTNGCDRWGTARIETEAETGQKDKAAGTFIVTHNLRHTDLNENPQHIFSGGHTLHLTQLLLEYSRQQYGVGMPPL